VARSLVRKIVVGCIGVLLAAAAASAQTRSSITGTVKDAGGGVLPGVTLTLESPGMVGGAQTDTSGTDGQYRFSDLPPAVYTLTAALQGFQTVKRTDLRVPFGTTLTIDVTMSVGAVSESLTVSGQSPVVDVKTSAATQKLDRELLEALPVTPNLHSFQAFEIFTLAPGVTTNRTAHGGSRDANNLMIDGVPSTIPNRAGIDSASFAYNWIQEVQIVSLGANAEYGDFSGTISNVVLRSGSNQLHGLGDFETTRAGWVGNNTRDLTPAQQVQFKPLNIPNQTDVSAQAGGPLVRDRLFFFGGYSYYYQRQIPSGSLGDTVRKDTLPRFMGKMNWAIAPTLKLEGLFEHDNLQVDNPKAGASVAPEANYSSNAPKYLWTNRLTWTPSNVTLVEFKTGGMHIFEGQTPRPPGTWDGPPGHTDRTTGIQSVNVASALGEDAGTRVLAGGAITHWVSEKWGRSHELKFGAEYEHLNYDEVARYAGNMLYQDVSGKADQVIIWNGSRVEGTGQRVSLYAQDTWGLTDRVTLQPGVRFAINRGSAPGAGKVYSTNPVSPRIGAAWDVMGDHRTVVRAHWGQFHEGLFTTLFQFMDTTDQNPKITARVLAPNVFQELTRFTPAGNFGIDPKIKQAYMNQFVAGIERELFTDVAVSVQYVYRNYKDIFAFVDTTSQWAPLTVPDPGIDNVLGTADDGPSFTAYNLLNPGQSFLLLTNPSNAKRRYSGVQFGMTKRLSHNWQASASYTYSKTDGNVSNAQGTNVGLGEAGTTGNFVDPNHLIGMDGRAGFDAPHQLLIQGTYRAPWFGGFNVSPRYRYQSGTPYGRTISVRGFSQGTETIRVEPRGTHRNSPTRLVDLRIEKTLPLQRPDRTLGVYVDVINLGNAGFGTVRETAGSTFGALASWSNPRTAQAGVRFTF